MKNFLHLFWLVVPAVIFSCAYEGEQQASDGYFEGRITYEITYQGDSAFDADSRDQMGSRSEYYFSKGNYYQEYNGRMLEYNMYLKDPNLYYTKHRGNDTLMVLDCDKEIQHAHGIFNISTKKTHENVMGRDCKIVTVNYKDNKTFLKRMDFYYNIDVLPIDTTWEAHNPVLNASAVFNTTRSLPMKIIYDYGTVKITLTATNIERMDLHQFFAEKKNNVIKAHLQPMN